MSFLKRIKLQQLKDKCKELKIKDYGSKILIVKRIEQHYIAQNLGVFILEDYVKELEESVENNESIVGSDEESDESLVESVETDSSQASKSSNVQPMSVDDIIINEEHEDEDGHMTSTSKKRKVTVKPIYIVHETIENAILAIEFIQNEGIWNNYCISNKTKDGTKSYYGCKNKGCVKKIGLWYDMDNLCTTWYLYE